jgi:transcriptional regulator with XRE-family HTH domain
VFFDRLKKLCDEKGISTYKACTDIGLNRAAVAKWKNGSIPGGSTAAKLADYFGVTTDYLLGKETEKAPTNSGEREMSDAELKFALWGDCEDVSDEDLEDVRRYAAFVRERKKDRK